MGYDRNALIALFEKKLLEFGYTAPDNNESLGYIYFGNDEFKLLSSLDDKALVVATRYDWIFDDYDFDNETKEIINDIIDFRVDDEEMFIRFIATVNFDEINEDNVITKVADSAKSISAIYCALYDDAKHLEWKRNYDFTPVTYSEFDCPVCGAHISYTPGTCPGCGKGYDAKSGEIECDVCGCVLDEIECPKCHAYLRQWDLDRSPAKNMNDKLNHE